MSEEEQNNDDPRKELESICRQKISRNMTDKEYEMEKAGDWAHSISDDIIEELKKDKGARYICTCFIVKKGGCSFHFSSSQLWSAADDACIVVRHDMEDMTIMVYLFIVSD
ncbi:MAG: dynein light chain Tctex-type family protein [archaeon]|nr:dynein light chain Tctex-type family protein [archaeon]